MSPFREHNYLDILSTCQDPYIMNRAMATGGNVNKGISENQFNINVIDFRFVVWAYIVK